MTTPEQAGQGAAPTRPGFHAVDHVPFWSVGLGVVGVLGTLAWALLREGLPGGGLTLAFLMVLSSLGVTLALCGVLLALRARRHLKPSLVGLVANCVLPALLFTGLPRG